MSSKPVKLPRWGATSPGVITGAITEPSEAKKDVGWVVRERPPASIFMWLFELIYEWLAYLAAGAFAGDHSIDGALTVGGQSLTVPATVFTADSATKIFTATGIDLQTGDGSLRVSTTTTLPVGLTAGTDYYAIRLTVNTFKLATSFANAVANTHLSISTDGTGVQTIVSFGATRPHDTSVSRSLTVGGNETVGGTLGVTGATTVGGTLGVTGATTVGGTLGVTGLITATAGVTAGSNQHITLSGTGALKHGTRTRIISPKMGGGYSPGLGRSVFQAIVGAGAGPPPITSLMECPLDEYFIFGDRIKEIRWNILDSATGPTTCHFFLTEIVISTLGTTVSNSNTSSGAGAAQILTLTGLSTMIVTDKFHTLTGSVVGGDNCTFYPFEVDFDHP